MIAFEDKITSELKEALKSKDQVKLDCLRAMKSALKYKDVEKKQAGVTEEEAIQIFQTMIKQRRDSVEQFEKFDRKDQAQKELREIEVIQSFLPQQLSEAEIQKLIQDSIQSTGSKGPQDMGKVMKELKSKVTGRADGRVVSELVKKALG